MEMYQNRLEAVWDKMNESSFDYLLLGPSANMYYFSGLETSPDERLQLLIIPAGSRPAALLPEMYLENAEAVLAGLFILEGWADSSDPFQQARAIVKGDNLKIAIDNTLRADHLIGLIKVLPGAVFEPASLLTGALRIRKDKQEIGLMQEAAKIADRVMAGVQQEIRPGMSEKELSLFIENEYKKLAGAISFPPIVASGPNSASPHHKTGDRAFKSGDFIVVDCGALYKGYCSDITRTFCLGKASDEMKKVYKTVQDSNTAAFEALKQNNNLSGEETDRASRSVISSAGYGPRFIHRTGHGIGLEVHEEPYIVAGNSEQLDSGMVFTIEPGIYLPGKFGVRIEDMAVITEQGPVFLTAFQRDLTEL